MRNLLLVIFGLFAFTVSSRVIELSDRFLDIRKDAYWFVMFYAPWCGHCKRLEPVWLHVAQALSKSNVRVGRIDCTRYSNVGIHFGIGGFPTIMFLRGDQKEYVYKGDRTKDELLNFAYRLSGPMVQEVTRKENIPFLEESKQLFFIYVGPYTGSVWEAYYTIAEIYQPFAYFYAVPQEVMNLHKEMKSSPSILVFKDNLYYTFDHQNHGTKALNMSLADWVNHERFHSFMKITKSNIHLVMQTNKNLALAVVKENVLEEIPEDMLIFKDIIKSVIIKHRDKYHRHFQFGWVGSPELANSIAMKELEPPVFLVINSSTNHHHISEWGKNVDKVSSQTVTSFLDSIIDDKAPKYGGNSWLIRLYRTYFDGKTALSEMWKGNPVLTSVLFGLPLGFLSLLLYSTCCADILDANTDDEDLDFQSGFSHEKKE